MHYTLPIDLAFSSIEHIMRDVNNGWMFRYLHVKGVSMFFIVIHTHIGRGLYYISYGYPGILMLATAFMGYVLPWGQMSFWGAKVITNLFSALPYVGKSVALWL